MAKIKQVKTSTSKKKKKGKKSGGSDEELAELLGDELGADDKNKPEEDKGESIKEDDVDQDQSKETKIDTYALEGKFVLVRVGSEENQADDPDIEDVREELESLIEKNNINCLLFVTHHAVDVTLI